MKKIILKSTLFASFILLFAFTQNYVLNAADIDEVSMLIKIDKESFSDPDYLDTEIIMEAPVNSYNAVMGVINYDPNFLMIEQAHIDDSFCKLIIGSLPSETEGTKTVICGNPDNNASSTMPLAKIRFKKINSGLTEINLNNSRMLSADGQARDLLHTNEMHYILIEK